MSGDALLECVEVATGGEPTAAVIWLHGLGADGNDFGPIVPELGFTDAPAVRFVFPHAPVRPVGINMGARMRAWYDIVDLDLRRDQDADGIQESAAHVERLLAREKQRGIPAARIVLAGFSQGGAIAYQVGLRHTERLAGILVLSGYLLFPEAVEAEATAANRETPILACHGVFDPMVSASTGGAAADHLRSIGYEVDWRTYPMEHSVHPSEIADVAIWLRKVLGG